MNTKKEEIITVDQNDPIALAKWEAGMKAERHKKYMLRKTKKAECWGCEW